MKRMVIAQYIALGATCLSVLGFFLSYSTSSTVGGTLMGLGILIGMVPYLFGGFGTAVKMAGTIAKWGWLVVPFPYDIVTGVVAFAVSLVVFIMVPIIPVRKAYKAKFTE